VAVMRACLPMWRNKEWPARGNAGTRREGRATRGEGEQEVEAALCTAAAGGGTASAAEQSRGAEGAQRKKMRGENGQGLKCKSKRSKGLSVK
jgi:hypothetical protein